MGGHGQNEKVQVLAQNGINSVLAILNENYSPQVPCAVCFDYPQFCLLHKCWMEDPNHMYEYHRCEVEIVSLKCPKCGNSFESTGD